MLERTEHTCARVLLARHLRKALLERRHGLLQCHRGRQGVDHVVLFKLFLLLLAQLTHPETLVATHAAPQARLVVIVFAVVVGFGLIGVKNGEHRRRGHGKVRLVRDVRLIPRQFRLQGNAAVADVGLGQATQSRVKGTNLEPRREDSFLGESCDGDHVVAQEVGVLGRRLLGVGAGLFDGLVCKLQRKLKARKSDGQEVVRYEVTATECGDLEKSLARIWQNARHRRCDGVSRRRRDQLD
mmetsp:Transcript_7494/g.14104  ORF Transcript_7494/g.14104 Transcript_7494/m.14104 type:complete len:241 (+) Transcript_7494:2256-2978(+)